VKTIIKELCITENGLKASYNRNTPKVFVDWDPSFVLRSETKESSDSSSDDGPNGPSLDP